ncbi:zeta toxin family protein [Herbiconiux sp. VKM Ac-2851]|uniref:zeta toxin family protein n=1 Tax=Herbiconiux sp. VKM Ac-2851 TaxID=2739025 RepID=UPI0015663730|nr:zeta toxin family protein [Herbiconiux sp. VKM Ac-2851]NQX34725.1 zeta toxin family protein [Herbiconiux sp. VKM Ac-2851]
MEAVRELSKPGQALAPFAPTATINNPAWWFNAEEPMPSRRRLHRRLLEEARDAAPEVEQQRRAIVLAGPPGAGKSTVLQQVLGADRGKYLVVDADEFKRGLLDEARADGSYDSWLMPDAIRELQAQGEQFYPLELAALVHEESSYLAKALRADAIHAGDNLVIDAVLSKEADAIRLGEILHAEGYDVQVIDVEVPYELSESRIRARWEHAYADALNGAGALGGRWVPSEYARAVFAGPDDPSLPEVAARSLAVSCPAVSHYRVFRTTMEQAHEPHAQPTVDVDMMRSSPSEPLTDSVSTATR